MTRRFLLWPAGLRRLWADRRGAIAPMAAFILIPLLLGAGMALDISRLISSRTQVQDAVDSANLALARMPASSTTAQLKAVAQAWINANVTDPNIINLQVQDPVRVLGQIQLTVTGDVKTVLSQNLGVNTLPLVGRSTVKYGTSHVELALVLDNTGSMAQDGKLDALKTAATNLVNTLSDSANTSGDPNALKISVVPFSMAVNVGSGYSGAAWIRGSVPPEYGATGDALGTGHPNRFTLFSQLNEAWKGCVESRPMPYDVSDADANPAIPASMFVPFFAPDEPDGGWYVWTPYSPRSHSSEYDGSSSYFSLNNYVADGVNDGYNKASKNGSWQSHQEAVAKYSTGFNPNPKHDSAIWGDKNGPNSGCNVAPLLRLTTDMTQVRNKLNAMIATGDTEIPLGLVWGWHTLSPNNPFQDGAAYGTTGVLKIVVLVTDGANTYGSNPYNQNGSFYTAYGYAAQKRIDPGGTAAGTAAALNTRLSALCTAMKTKDANNKDKVIIYTVPIGVSDPTIKGLLQGCATQADYYIDVPDAASLNGAFANIAGSISGLRLAH